MFKGDRIACSKYGNHSKLNNEQNQGGGATWLFDEHKNPHFDNVERTRDIHMRYGNDKESGYGLGLELITSFLLIVCSIS